MWYNKPRGEIMFKLYKDLTILYYVASIVGVSVLFFVPDSFVPALVSVIVALVWIFFCTVVIQKIATKRFNKMLLMANEFCQIEKSLNCLFGVYKGRLNSKIDLIVAIYISSLLLHFGKHNLSLNILLPYNPEALFTLKSEAVYKYLYYNTLTVCYSRLNRKEDALNASNEVAKILSDTSFNRKLKPYYEINQRINYLIVNDNGDQVEEILELLDKLLTNSSQLLGKVSNRFVFVRTLIKYGRIDEAEEHIEFIKENGGDTLYAKCALQNDFSEDFINKINLEPWEPHPIGARKLTVEYN